MEANVLKSKNKIVAFVFILIISITFAIVYFVVIRTPSAKKVFNDSINNVVELKASSESVGESFGTAVLVNKDGTLITNAHVVMYSRLGQLNTFEEYEIRFNDEENYRAVELLKYDENLDLAVLKLDAEKLKHKPISIGDSSNLKYGQKVYAIGNAMNYGISITEGIISNPLIEISYEDVLRKVIQCDIVINEGNSGGALLNERGQLIGITTFRIKDNRGNTVYGLGFCVPIDSAIEYVIKAKR